METEGEVSSAPSTPATPSTPGAPLFDAFKSERNGSLRISPLLKNCNLFSFDPWSIEDGNLDRVSCLLPHPSISLARKVGAEIIGIMILILGGTVLQKNCNLFVTSEDDHREQHLNTSFDE